jgi:tetratricopeptide (TPR) repeat protein
MLQQFVLLPQPPEKLAEAWFLLAKTREDLGQKDAARQAYLKCIEYPSSPCAARARNQIAVGLSRQKQFKEAEEILRDNLRLSDAQHDREAREEALFQLGIVLYRQQKYSQASIKLQEAARQYPANAQVFVARDLLGDSFRKLGEEAGQRARGLPHALPQESNAVEHERRKWLEQAADVYRSLEADLKDRKARQPLAAREEKILRKAAFADADIRFDLNEFSESLVRYKLLASRYRGQLEELYACQRIVMTCQALRFQPRQLHAALQAARAVLPSARENLSLATDAQFQGPAGAWTRAQWAVYLQNAEAQLKELSRLAQPPA